MMGSGMAAHEWRGPHIWQEKIEALEKENAELKTELRDLNTINEALSQANTDICNQLAALKRQVSLLKHALDECAYDVLARSGKGHEAIRAAYAALAATEPKES